MWYPQLTRRESIDLPQRLKRLPAKGWVRRAAGAGAFQGRLRHARQWHCAQPAWWTPHAALVETMPWLTGKLALDEGAGFTLEQHAA